MSTSLPPEPDRLRIPDEAEPTPATLTPWRTPTGGAVTDEYRSGPPPGPDYPQGSPHLGTSHPDPARHALAAVALRAAAARLPREIDSADLTVAGGDVVQIVCVAEVIDWLVALAVRTEAGEPL